MAKWSGAETRCKVCNKYLPDRCTCNGPSIEESRNMSESTRATAAPDLTDYTTRVVQTNTAVMPGVVFVCPERDIECGNRPVNWCEKCPQRPSPSTGGEPTKICRKQAGCPDIWKCSSAKVGDCGAQDQILQSAAGGEPATDSAARPAWKSERMVSMPHPNSKGLRIIGFVVPCSDKDMMPSARMEEIISAAREPATDSAARVKDHVLREVVNKLRDTAIKYHATGQLRERLRVELEPLLAARELAPVARELDVESVDELLESWFGLAGCKGLFNRDRMLAYTRAAVAQATAESAPASAAPDWQTVPKEPTEAMMDAAEACSTDWPRTTWKAAWTAMLAAAPSNSSPVGAKESK